jgi:aerobic-type carbon monoxide dehydrogenase small subunit (CoxS/CutS family)
MSQGRAEVCTVVVDSERTLSYLSPAAQHQ